MDGLGNPVLVESMDESLDHSTDDDPPVRFIKVDRSLPPNSTMAVGAVVPSSSGGRRAKGVGWGDDDDVDSPSSTRDRPLRFELMMFDLDDVLR